MRDTFDRDGLPALFARSESADLQHLLLPSEIFHENTKTRRGVRELRQRAIQDPVTRTILRRAETRLRQLHTLVQFGTKAYPHLPRVRLPAVSPRLDRDLAEAIRQRRSDRRLSGVPVSLPALATLLELAYGVMRYVDPVALRLPRRAVPSGGGLYPLEVYALASTIEGLEAGVYHFEAFDHVLERLPGGGSTIRVETCFLDDDIAAAAVIIVVTAVVNRLRHKYGEMAYRLALLEAGHVGQNLCLVATALGLGVCPLAAYIDDAVHDLLGVDGVDETVIHALAVGHRSAEGGKPARPTP